MTNPKWAFALRGEGSETLEIDIYDIIGESFWREGVSAKSVRAKLKEAKNASTIKLRVNSRGGDVIDGFAIYNLLNEHSARVEADVDALAASMASVILMAADEIRIAANGFVMIHNPWGVSIGESDDLRATADLLDKMRDQIAAAYVARTGMDRDRVLKMMDDETWMTPAEAKEHGFVDKVRGAKKGAAGAKAFAGLDLSELLHVPTQFMAACAAARTEISSSARRRELTSVEDDEESDMADELKTALATLGVATVAEGAARLALLARIEAATGKTGDEAHGLIGAALSSHAELPKAKVRIAELEKANEGAQLAALIAKGKDDKKVTPALEASLKAQFDAGDITLKGVEAMLANLSPMAALGPKGAKPPPAPGASGGAGAGGAPTHNGKTYAELTHPERAELSRQDPELYKTMRATFKPGAR